MSPKYFAFFILCCFTSQANGQEVFSGVYVEAKDSFLYHDRSSWSSFKYQHQQLDSNQFHLVELEITRGNKGSHFWGIWQLDSIPSVIERVNGWKEMVKMKRKMVKEGYLMEDIETYFDQKGNQYFIGIWKPSKTMHKMWKLDTWEGVLQKSKEMAVLKYYPVDIEPFKDKDGVIKFLALFHKRQHTDRAHIFATNQRKLFNTDSLQRYKSGFRMVDFETFPTAEGIFQIGVYRKKPFRAKLQLELATQNIATEKQKEIESEFYQLVDLEFSKS